VDSDDVELSVSGDKPEAGSRLTGLAITREERRDEARRRMMLANFMMGKLRVNWMRVAKTRRSKTR
jgi:hypothetical protein